MAFPASELTNWMEGIGGIATAAAFGVAALTLWVTDRSTKAEAHRREASLLRQEMRNVLEAIRTLESEVGRRDPLLAFSVCLGDQIRRHLPPTTTVREAVERLATDDRWRRRLIMAASDEGSAFRRVRSTMERLEHADLALRGRLRIISTSVRMLLRALSGLYSVDSLVDVYSDSMLRSELAGGRLEGGSRSIVESPDSLDSFLEDRARLHSEYLIEPIVPEVVDLIRESYTALVALGDRELVGLSLSENPEAEATPTFTEEISLRLKDLRSDLAPATLERLTAEAEQVRFVFEDYRKRLEALGEAYPAREGTDEEHARILGELTTFPREERGKAALAQFQRIPPNGFGPLLRLVHDEIQCRQPDAQFAPGVYLAPQEAADLADLGIAAAYEPERRDDAGNLLYQLTPAGRETGSLLAAAGPLPPYLGADDDLRRVRGEAAREDDPVARPPR
jgi:hypothetical protein